MSSTKAIEQFLRPPNEGGAYTEGRLAELLAHAEDGKLSFYSCCCLVGIPTAPHALRGREGDDLCFVSRNWWHSGAPIESKAESEFDDLSMVGGEKGDALRRARLIPLIHAEFARREAMRNTDTQPDSGFPSEHVESPSSLQPEKVLV